MGFKLWKLPEEAPDKIEALARESGLPWVLCAVLVSRGISTADEAQSILTGSEEIENPFVLSDMDKAVERISEAVENGERIAIYGDYDCDGVTATALLVSYFQSVGADVIYYVPCREKEGYGLNNAAIEMLKGQKVDLIITVDNGISAHAEIEFASSLGIDVVVTDHHTPRPTLPNAVAVVNPHRSDCKSAYKELAGVGVAFKLVCALENAPAAELLEYYSDLVALGTIADVVPLTGENRTIVKHGLSRLRDNERPGIEALIKVSGLEGKDLGCEQVAFGMIPRINAAGRMGVVDDVIELLLTDDAGYAEEVADIIDSQNVERKKAEELILREIEEILSAKQEILLKRVIVISGKGWHHGVVGIVASKIMERYGKPCILLSADGDTARGSGRSIEGFSLIQAISECKEHLLQFGGHAMAAGMTLKTSLIEEFDESLQRFARDSCKRMPVASCKLDCVLPPNRLTIENIASLSALEPFGASNESPLFLLKKLAIEGVYPTADQKHIRLRLNYGGTQFYAVYFGMTEKSFPYREGSVVDAIAAVTAGEYNGKPQLSVRVRDIRPSTVRQDEILECSEAYSTHLRGEYADNPDFSRLLADRDDLAVVYKFLRRQGEYAYDLLSLYYQLMDSGIGYCRMLVSLDIMEELGLIKRSGGEKISLIHNPPKVNIEDSKILSDLKSEMQVIQRG